jgi:hypothetical protein
VATRFYFHATTNSTSGLPTAEQSSLTADQSADAATLNRTMNTTIGTAQTSIAQSSIATTATRNYYFCRFVSQPIFQSSIAANTWTYNFAAKESTTAGNFPVAATNQPVRVNCYVWRPSTSTKIGTILDGNTASTVDEVNPPDEAAHHVTFSGSAVSSMQNDDVIILEIWFIITQPAAVSSTDTFYFDGTTANTTDNAVVSNHASFLETPENLTLTAGPVTLVRNVEDTITLSESQSRVYSSLRQPTDGVSISDSVANIITFARTVSTDSTSLSESTSRQFTSARSVTDTIGQKISIMRGLPSEDIAVVPGIVHPTGFTTGAGVQEAVTRSVILAPRTVQDTITLSESVDGGRLYQRTPAADTITLSESVSRLYSALRTIQDTIPVSETVALGSNLFTRILSDPTIVLSESIDAGRLYIRTPSADTVTLSESVARVLSLRRTLGDSTIVQSESVVKALTAIRIFLETPMGVIESLQSFRVYTRTPTTDTISLSESIARLLELIRDTGPPDTVAASESVSGVPVRVRTPATDTITLSESIDKFRISFRTLADTILQSEPNAQRLIELKRAIQDTVSAAENILKTLIHVRPVDTDTTTLSEVVARALQIKRQPTTDTVATSESVSRLTQFRRTLQDATIAVADASFGQLILGIRRVFLLKGAFYTSDK